MRLPKTILIPYILVFSLSLLFCYIAEAATYRDDAAQERLGLSVEQAQERADLIATYYNRGREFLLRDKFDEAIASFNEVLRLEPSYQPAQEYLKTATSDKQVYLANEYFDKGKICYNKGEFQKAAVNFEEALKILPYHEPAKVYHNLALIQHKINLKQDEIESIKVKMADIVSDYDKKSKQTEGLTVGYLLEQALLRCQAGDYNGAKNYYNLCYKLDPKNKDRIMWFVDATYELEDLSDSLNECYDEIESLPELNLSR
ncbi:MAG: tetratricopeptide repeat protein [Candidatus Omnitrophota bacterium]